MPQLPKEYLDIQTGVYQIRNLVNGKIYVGATLTGFQVRWKLHKSGFFSWRGSSTNPHLRKDVQTLGASSVKFEVVQRCHPIDSDINEWNRVQLLKSKGVILYNREVKRFWPWGEYGLAYSKGWQFLSDPVKESKALAAIQRYADFHFRSFDEQLAKCLSVPPFRKWYNGN